MGAPTTRFTLALPGLVALLGCGGYHLGSPTIESAHSVSIPILENLTLRRGNEFGLGSHEIDLAQRICDAVQVTTDYDVVAQRDADLTVRVEILSYDTPFIVDDSADRPLLSAVSIEVRLRILRRDGSVVFDGKETKVGHFVPGRAEDEGSARAEAFERISQWVVTRLEGGW